MDEGKGAGKGGKRKKETEDTVTRVYNSTFMSGKIRQAVRKATDREGGLVRRIHDKYSKTGLPIIKVIRQKHPATRITDYSNEKYECKRATILEPPQTVPVQCTEEVFTRAAKRIGGGPGPSGVDSHSLSC